MIRKLKPLKQILAENPDYEFEINGKIILKNSEIPTILFRYFGKTVTVYYNGGCNGFFVCDDGYIYHESWFEPIKEKVQYYQVMYDFEDVLYIEDRLYKSESDFIKINPKANIVQLIPCGEPVDE
jgi:hypothetical protein